MALLENEEDAILMILGDSDIFFVRSSLFEPLEETYHKTCEFMKLWSLVIRFKRKYQLKIGIFGTYDI